MSVIEESPHQTSKNIEELKQMTPRPRVQGMSYEPAVAEYQVLVA